MNLRSRLLTLAAIIMVLVVVLLIGIAARQRAILTDQVDEQLELIANSTLRRVGGLAEVPLPDATTDTISSDLFIAGIGPSDAVIVIAEPVTGPSITPDVDEARTLTQATTSDGSINLDPSTAQWGTDGEDVRVLVVDIGLERSIIIARSMEPIDAAQNQILVASALAVAAIAAVLGLAIWWVDRLGLQPIRTLTSAAEDVAAGRSERRVSLSTTDDEAGRLGAAFNAMLDARQESERRQRQFVADASHELRTPLTVLRGYADLYLSNGLTTPDAVGDAMRRIQVEGARMAALTEDLLTLASLDEGRPLDRVDLDLSALIIDIAADAAAIDPVRRVDSEGVDDGLVVHADRDLITQAITAATTNVARHTPATAGLVLAASLHGDAVQIRVADHGPGIPQSQVEHLFDRFYRGDPGRDTASGGRGLGLPIAKTVLEAHGGKISASSTPGVGTLIEMVLPVAGVSGA